MGEFMLTVLGGVATLERHLIKARTDTGIKRARAAGIKFGRPNALAKHQQEEALKLLADGKLQRGGAAVQRRSGYDFKAG
jgi:putative DNA-invertase from lambdoid prophage Rac